MSSSNGISWCWPTWSSVVCSNFVFPTHRLAQLRFLSSTTEQSGTKDGNSNRRDIHVLTPQWCCWVGGTIVTALFWWQVSVGRCVVLENSARHIWNVGHPRDWCDCNTHTRAENFLYLNPGSAISQQSLRRNTFQSGIIGYYKTPQTKIDKSSPNLFNFCLNG